MSDWNEALTLDEAREAVYRFLAALLSHPQGEQFHCALTPANRELIRQAVAVVREDGWEACDSLGHGELPAQFLDLDDLWGELDASANAQVGPADLKALARNAGLDAEYDRVFGLNGCRECPPFETEFLANHEPFYVSQHMADAAGFYAAFGLATPERPDALVDELEFMAFLLAKARLAAGPEVAEHREVCQKALRDFFADHLAWWAPLFARGLERKAGGGFYGALARLLAAFLPLERVQMGVPTPAKSIGPRGGGLPMVAEDHPDDSCTACSALCSG